MRKKLRNDKGAMSEVVGALMLTLIVVIAASSYAIFIAEKQKIEQDSQLLEAKKKAEKLTIMSIHPTSESGSWESFNFTISSYHKQSSIIRQLSIDDAVARNYNVTKYNPINGQLIKISMNYSQSIIIEPGETIYLNVTTDDLFIRPNLPDDYNIKLSLQTDYGNLFERAFIAPCPLIKIETESMPNGTNFDDYLFLDGSSSYQEGDGSIIRWSWNILVNNTNYLLLDESGPKIRFKLLSDSDYYVTLSITNSYGMKKDITMTYTTK